EKAKEWDDIIKIGRTHLADATPIRLGQEVSGYARQVELCVDRAKRALHAVIELPAGGTAVGTGINTHPEFDAKAAQVLAKATGGQFELNIMMPVMGLAIVESIDLLSASVKAFIDFCALEMEANRQACEKQVEWSMAMVTSLNPLIGYDVAASVAKEAFKVGKTVRDLCLEKMKAGTLKKKDSDAVVTEAELNKALDLRSMTEASA